MLVVTQRCTRCASELPPDARFCPECGAPTPRASTRAPPAAGERRQVAILFADLSGYTRLSGSLDPEETHRLLTRFFELTDEIIERCGGTIDKHIGDAVMAVFGAPVAYGNDVERALRAASAIHAGMSALSAEVGRALDTHVGIASGEVVAAATGSSARHDYTVTGDAVNLAARLTDLAAAGETVLSDDVSRAIGAVAQIEPLGRVPIRGVGDAVRAWRLVALHAPRSKAPIFGRERERACFAEMLAGALDGGAGAVTLLCADPGMGKSRLAEALLADAAATGVGCHAATVLDFGAGQGRDAIHALVASLLGIRAGDAQDARREALERAIATGSAAGSEEPYLADLLLIPQRAARLYEAMDNDARRAGKLRALVAVVKRAAETRPLMLLVEDVHWASAWVLECLRALADAAAQRPVVLTMTTRRDGDPVTGRWPADRLVRFDLPPLDRHDALALARAHLEGEPDLALRCVDRAQGNPLFLVQLLGSEVDESSVPATIQSVVLARLDRLAPRDKAALQAAAVVGQRFPLDLLRHLVRDAEYVPAVAIARDLVRADERDPAFMLFTHALIRDGAYASLLRAGRRELHLAAAAWYETRDSTLYAEHLERADDPGAARAWLAAARAEMAAMRTDAALGLAMRGARLPAPSSVRFALASLEGDLQRELGDGARSIAAFERARDAAADDAQRCVAWIGIAAGYRSTSTVAEGLDALDVAASFAGDALVRERAHIAYLRGSLHFARADVGECRRHHEQALALAREACDAELEAWALSGLADALYAQGAMRSALRAFTQCLGVCEREAMTRFSLMNHCMVAIIDAHFGPLECALERVARTRDEAREVRYRLAEVMCDESEAWILVGAGREGEAAAALARGIPAAREIGARRFETILQYSAAHLAWHEGRRDDARTHLRHAWTLSEDVGPHFAGPIVLGALAKFAALPDERERALRDGERLLREPCVAHCHVGFYRDAIDAALADGAWSEAERYAAALEDAARAEPLPAVDLMVARGRALAAAGRGRADRAALEACRRQAVAWHYARYLPALDAALAAGR